MLIHVAHSPDSDDAFMFYALAKNKIPTGDLEFVHVLKDIETLNHEAFHGTHEISAVSIHAYAHIADQYALLGSGASMGEQYGPMLVSKRPLSVNELKCKKIAIPGVLTSAFLTLKMIEPKLRCYVVPFDQIMEKVEKEEVDAGLIIHEGQLQYKDRGLHLVVDLGKWWYEQTGLPLPLGGNAVRRDLGPKLTKRLAQLQKESIAYGLSHREDALQHALQYAGDLSPKQADRFVSMYVNERTLDYGKEGKEAVCKILDLAYQKKIIPRKVKVEFVE